MQVTMMTPVEEKQDEKVRDNIHNDVNSQFSIYFNNNNHFNNSNPTLETSSGLVTTIMTKIYERELHKNQANHYTAASLSYKVEKLHKTVKISILKTSKFNYPFS